MRKAHFLVALLTLVGFLTLEGIAPCCLSLAVETMDCCKTSAGSATRVKSPNCCRVDPASAASQPLTLQDLPPSPSFKQMGRTTAPESTAQETVSGSTLARFHFSRPLRPRDESVPLFLQNASLLI